MSKKLAVVGVVAFALAVGVGANINVLLGVTEPTVEVNGTAIESVTVDKHHTTVTLNDSDVVTRLVVYVQGSEYTHSHPSNDSVELFIPWGNGFTIHAQTGDKIIGTATVKR